MCHDLDLKVLISREITTFWSKNRKKVQFLCRKYFSHMSRICPIFSAKIAHFLGNSHFFGKKVQFFAIFVHKYFWKSSRICPIFRGFFIKKVLISSIFSDFSEKSWKKVQFFAQNISAYVTALLGLPALVAVILKCDHINVPRMWLHIQNVSAVYLPFSGLDLSKKCSKPP